MHPRRWLVFLASTLTLLSVAAIASETKTDINTDYPLLPLVVAEPGTWAPNQTDYVFFGDVRAVLNVTSSDQSITAQIFWRRRDKNPGSKLVIVTDAEHNVMPVLVQQITQECGFVTFSAKRGPGVYYVYYMPYYQYDQSGFQTHFHWYNCSEHVEQCEMSIQSDLCTTVMEPANVTVVELQGRSVFYGPTQTELIALPNEIAAVTDRYKGQPFIAVAESRGNSIRMMGGASQVPAEWARRSTSLTSLTDTAWIGEFWTFQVALFAAYGPIDGVAVSVSDGVGKTPIADASSVDLDLHIHNQL